MTPRLRRATAALASLAALTGCASLPPDAPRAPSLDAARVAGAWYVLASNFPMWLTGEKRDPLFLYKVNNPGAFPAELDDTVAYVESGRRETIEGTDYQDPNNAAHFTWRGKGILFAFASDWVISAVGPEGRWMVLYFTKTVATPEGVDVIARSPTLSDEDRAAVTKLLAADPFLAPRATGLVWLQRSDAPSPAP